jgi:uncharacterized protein YciI
VVNPPQAPATSGPASDVIGLSSRPSAHAERLADMRAHAEVVERAAPDVVDVLLRTPRAHLDWLLETRRYA